MKHIEEQIENLKTNQGHVIEAVKNLNVGFEAIERAIDLEKLKDVEEIIDSQEIIDELVVKMSDDIKILQESKNINLLTIEKMDSEITMIKDKEREILESIRDSARGNEDGKGLVGKCRYWDRGYCKFRNRCKFVHPPEICEIFLQGGKCDGESCYKRHPSSCWFWKGYGCIKGKLCAYLHIEAEQNINCRKCDRCFILTNKTYYCEFCEKTFCEHCAIEEAHTKVGKNVENCSNIHQNPIIIDEEFEPEIKSSDNNETKADNDLEIKSNKCQCNLKAKVNLSKCENCEKYFCKDCSMYPMEDQANCLQCMASEIFNEN